MKARAARREVAIFERELGGTVGSMPLSYL
jgi:hypothetical protein